MNEVKAKTKSEVCSIVEAAKLVADPAILLIVKRLMDGPKRYNEIKDYVTVVSEATLSSRLKKLVQLKLIERKQFESIPPKVVYQLSDKSKELTKVVDALENFGNCYLDSK